MNAERPYPRPTSNPVMSMGWIDLAFLHWKVPAESLRRLIPPALELDRFEGEAWLGIVPFRMAEVRPRGLPAMPWVSAFPELNVRTYVTHGGKPGVWFFSLDAANPVAVRLARWFFHLPYVDARMSCTSPTEGRIEYRSRRVDRHAPPAEFVASYEPAGEFAPAMPGTLEWFLSARYCLYAANRAGRVFRSEVDHPPWELAPGRVEVRTNTMADPVGLRLEGPPLAHVARPFVAEGWRLEPIDGG